jgi:hypothetical protein
MTETAAAAATYYLNSYDSVNGHANLFDPDAWRNITLGKWNSTMDVNRFNDIPNVNAIPSRKQSLVKRALFVSLGQFYRVAVWKIIPNMRIVAMTLTDINTSVFDGQFTHITVRISPRSSGH